MPKSRKPRKASRKTSRKGKKCPPGCVKKTLKRSRKSTKRSRKSTKRSRRRVSRKASRKRESVKRKVSRKRKSVKRKVSRKRRSVKRKVSRKRKSAKRKSRKRKSAKRKSRKRRSVKRKVSRKRRSVKRKVSRKRKSAKRKASRKRKSAKRKASRKRKSVTKSHKFRFWGKIKGFIPGTRARSNRLADQRIRKQQMDRKRQTYKEYLQPLIKNYYPGHPQSLYYAVAKYYIVKIADVPSKLVMLDAGTLIPMKFPASYGPGKKGIDKYKKENKKKIGQAYRLYYEAMHKAHLKDCKKTGGYCIKSRSKFVGHHWRQHNDVAESAKRIAATKSLYGKCLKNKKRSSKVHWNEESKSYELVATPNSPYSNQIKAYMHKIGCDNLPVNLKTKIDNEIIQEAKTAKRVKQGKFTRWSRSLKKNKGAAVTNYQKSDKYKQYKAVQAQAQATIPWVKRTPVGKLIGCRKGRARLQELSNKGQSRTSTEKAERTAVIETIQSKRM